MGWWFWEGGGAVNRTPTQPSPAQVVLSCEVELRGGGGG